MVKIILIFSVVLLPTISWGGGSCAWTTTASATSLGWNNAASWTSSGTCSGSYPFFNPLGNEDIINITFSVTFIGNMTLPNNTTMNINSPSTLTVTGNMDLQSDCYFTVNSNAGLVVNGNLNNSNNSDQIIINGNVSVGGNLTSGNGSTITSPSGTGIISVAGSISGAGTVFGSSSDCPDTGSPCVTSDQNTLPIELTSFYTNNSDDKVNIFWTTASENNSSHFKLEYSREGIYWNVLSLIDAAGNSTTDLEYMASDMNPNEGVNYYRLIQFDIDGNSTIYGPISSIFNGDDRKINVYPNPGDEKIYIQYNNKIEKDKVKLSISDSKGIEVYQRDYTSEIGVSTYVIDDFNFAAGIYYIRLFSENAPECVSKYIRK